MKWLQTGNPDGLNTDFSTPLVLFIFEQSLATMNSMSDKADEMKEEFCYVLVGNIIDKHYYGEDKEIKSGTRHFRAGAKVYLFPEYGGMGHEKIPVYGLPRRSRKNIQVVINASSIKNLRVKKTYDQKMIGKIKDNHFYTTHKNEERSLKKFASYLNESNAEIIDEQSPPGLLKLLPWIRAIFRAS